MPNENCLAGMRCPKCGSYGPYRISVVCTMEVTDEGTDYYRDVEWDPDSVCSCSECNYTGKVQDFYGTDGSCVEDRNRTREREKTVSTREEIQKRLDYLRGEIKAERISYGEIAELQSLAEHIDPGDVVLLQWAGIEETTGG